MARYLTTTQYRSADDGIADAATLSDFTLARTISRAESDIDAYMGFDLKNGGFEPHTVWTQAQFDERSLRMHSPNGPVPPRRVVRYRIQVSNLSSTGAGFFATISQNDCAINVFDQYIEIVPLQSITYSLAPVLIQLGLRPPIVQMDTEIGFYLAYVADILYLTSTPNVYAALRGFWAQTYTQSLASQPNTLPPIPPVVYVNGVVQTSGYMIDYTNGQVTFSPPLSGSPVVTADYTATIPDEVSGACIDQTSHLLGLRSLNKQGMMGLGMARSGDVELRTVESFPARFQNETGALCDRAAKKLARYIEIPVA